MKSSFEKDININHLVDSLSNEKNPIIVALWGASGSGKSTLAKFLSQKVPDTSIFPVDRYLSPDLNTTIFDHSPDNTNEVYIEGLNPNIWDQDLLNKHLSLIAMRRSINMPIFNHKSRERIGYEPFTPSRVTIIEGAYAMENDIKQHINSRIIIRSPLHDRFIRKLLRTTHISGRTDVDESIIRYLERAEPTTNFYYKKYSSSADFIIDNPSHPRCEFSEYIPQEMFENTTHIQYIHPLYKFGALHEGELMSVQNSVAEDFIFRYNLDGKTLLKASIGKHTVDTLKKYYRSL